MEKLSELKVALEMLNQVTTGSKKSEMKSIAENVHNIVFDRSIMWNKFIMSDLFNVIDSTRSFNHMKWGRKNGMLLRIDYAKEYLEKGIVTIEKNGETFEKQEKYWSTD